MVVEHFAPGCKAKIYERFHAKGRRLPGWAECVWLRPAPWF